MKVDFYKHNVGPEEIKSVNKVLKSLMLTAGPVTREFEAKLAEYTGNAHGVGVTSWTMGGLIALDALGIKPGDEVITCPATFISTSNIAIYLGAKPVFVDADPETGNIREDLIEKAITKKTKAIIPVHLYGQMCDMKKIRKIADKYKLKVIEDCAHCIEGERDGVKPGNLSDAAVFSFYGTKNITCGEGGGIVTNSKELADQLLVMRSHGMSKSAGMRYVEKYRHWDMEVLGWKCNMSDIQAAMLIPQLRKIDDYLKKKEAICQKYQKAFSKLKNISFPKVLPNSKHARHLFTIWVPPAKRDWMLGFLQDKQIGVAVNFRAVHLMEYYKREHGFKRGMFPEAERIGDSTVTLPMYPKMTPAEVAYVIDSVTEASKLL